MEHSIYQHPSGIIVDWDLKRNIYVQCPSIGSVPVKMREQTAMHGIESPHNDVTNPTVCHLERTTTLLINLGRVSSRTNYLMSVHILRLCISLNKIDNKIQWKKVLHPLKSGWELSITPDDSLFEPV